MSLCIIRRKGATLRTALHFGCQVMLLLRVRVPICGSARSSKIPKRTTLWAVLQLSEGPAYGSAILSSVARGWVILQCHRGPVRGADRLVHQSPHQCACTGSNRCHHAHGTGRSVEPGRCQSQDEFGKLAGSFQWDGRTSGANCLHIARICWGCCARTPQPLTALQANIELARDERTETERTRYLSRAQEQGQRLEALVESLLDLSRIEAAETKFNFIPIDISRN